MRLETIMAALELYHGMASTCSKKVRMCLYEKRLPFGSRLLDLQKFEQHTPEYLALNPNGVVPTLVHDGTPIIESSIIIDYIDDAFPQFPLKPRDPRQIAQMRLWIKYSDEVAYKAVYAPTWQRLKARASQSLAAEKLVSTLSNVPTRERRERWEKMASGGFSEEELSDAYDQMRRCLSQASAQLESTQWLAGPMFTLADIAILPFVVRISNLRPEFLLDDGLAPLRRWLIEARARPSFEKAFDFKDDPRAAELPNF